MAITGRGTMPGTSTADDVAVRPLELMESEFDAPTPDPRRLVTQHAGVNDTE